MGKVIDRILAKVTRAKQHVQDFQLGLSAFYDTNPYAVGRKEDSQTGRRIFYVTKADPVPDDLTAIAADVIQNLRSPLDHIAYQLVLDARSGTEPDWTVYYPISGSATHYPATRGGKIKGVRQEVIDAIDATEPYKGGKGHALWQLNELNKPDKHELLIGAGALVGVDIGGTFTQTFAAVGFKTSLESFVVRPVNQLLALKLGDELYREFVTTQMAEQRKFTFDVAFNNPGVIECEPALKTLQDMTNLVDEIITKLGRLLP